MGFETKRIDLDANGAGNVTVPPCYFAGAAEGTPGDLASAVIVANGYSLGTALLTGATEKVVAGRVDVSGGVAGGAAILYFDVK